MVDFRIRGEAGAMAELRNIVKTGVEVLPVEDLSEAFFFFFFLVGDATQVTYVRHARAQAAW